MRAWTRWQSWLNVIVGIWMFISPWVLRYTDVSDGALNAWIFGVVTVLVAVWAQSVHRPVQRPTGPIDRLDMR